MMLEGRQALDQSLTLAQMPTLASAMRANPIPVDTLVVIRIAAGCIETSREAAELTGAPLKALREAAILYLQLVLMESENTGHRVLGVSPGAPRSQMREHMRWLLQWLHPDRNPNEWESVFAERVIRAWKDVGAGSAKPAPQGKIAAPGRSRDKISGRPRMVNRWVAMPIAPELQRRRKLRRGLLIAVILAVSGIAVLSIPAVSPVSKWLASASQNGHGQ